MRITENMTFAIAARAQARTTQAFAEKARIAASGLKVEAPSDGPAAYSAAVRAGARRSVMQMRATSASLGAGDLDLAESSLASAGDLMIRARELAVEGASDTMSASDRASAGTEVASIRTALIALANARGSGGFLFGGTSTATAPVNAAGTFTGNDTAVSLEVGDGVTMRSNASGALAFTAAGGRDVFADLASLASALNTNNGAGVRAQIDNVDTSMRQLVTARADVGMRAERLRSVADVAGTAAIGLSATIASEVEADAPEAYSQLTAAQTAYERSLAVTRQMLSLPTLAQL